MRAIDLGYKVVQKEEVQSMDLVELNTLMCELQEQIHITAVEKNKLTTLPKNKKDGKTIVRVRNLTEKIMQLQDAVNYVSSVKKAKRDSQSRERDWLKNFYNLVQLSVRKGVFDKLVSETTAQIGYAKP